MPSHVIESLLSCRFWQGVSEILCLDRNTFDFPFSNRYFQCKFQNRFGAVLMPILRPP